ncbi:MAG TPA: 3-deoxy-D-manno-octulosonic acid transferase [Xanthobacteraceae bacterium]|nr:3-deoxy-D-manno-octulosonic acid transferase [Xanthobacteraceae bacterium]HWW48850.1 3-deoxy-D-manno-octulosonic acid transferase [Xanthobacteraceae bacterium]
MPSRRRLPLTLQAYRRLSAAATPFAGAIIKRRLKKNKEDPARTGERRGFSSLERPAGPLVWIHGASVGEVLAVGGLIDDLYMRGFQILLTSGTATSAAVVASRFSGKVIHQYIPYDVPRFVARFLDHWQPDLALFVESDLWPNLILGCGRRRVPMVLINGRMSQRSFPRWQRLSVTIRELLGRFDLCVVQSETDASRFSALGGRDVVIAGNLKLDVNAPPANRERLEQLRSVTHGRPVVVAASTHPGEEELIAAAHVRLAETYPSLLTIIVPRHPARGPEVAQMIADGGCEVALRSHGELPSADTEIYVADTMGELGLFYRLSPIVFMGGSLVEHGGQNPIEAIKLGAAIVHGPHVFNFTDLYRALDHSGGALNVADVEALAERIGVWLGDEGARQDSVMAAEGVVRDMGGALRKTLSAIQPYLMQIELGAHDA